MRNLNKPSIINGSQGSETNSMIELDKFIDRCIIDEYATKNLQEGYYLDIQTVPAHDQMNFLVKLMEADTGLRDYALHYMQKMIDERLPEVELEEREHMGFAARRDDYDVCLYKYGA